MADDSLEIMLGGRAMRVRSADGQEHDITVRHLKIRELPAYAGALDDEVKLAALFTGRDDAFIESLCPESHEAVIAAGEEINGDFFARWCERRIRRTEAVAPGLTQRVMAMASPSGASQPS